MNRPCLPGIAFLYEGGVPKNRIRKMTGHSDRLIYQAIDRFAVASRRLRKGEVPFCLDTLRRRYEAGASTVELAAHYDRDQRTIAGYLRKAGAQIRPRGRPPKRRESRQAGWNGELIIDEGWVIWDYQAGLPVLDLCRKHMISHGTLFRILRLNSIPLRSPQCSHAVPRKRLRNLSEAPTG